MRGFGFYTRLMAIFWLFGLVLSNFGEGWLQPDSAILRVGKPKEIEPLKPLSQIAEEAKPRHPRDLVSGGSRTESERRAGWGGGETATNGPDPEMSDWGAEIQP